jgi:thiol-disulfide isomerase/thioredoxin
MPIEVQMLSAVWCKRCQTLKPDVERLCSLAGATFTYVDYDDLEEDDEVKKAVTALPTIRMRTGDNGAWTSYTPADLDTWKVVIAAASLACQTNDTDF